MIAITLLSAVAVIEWPVLARVFGVAPLHLDDWMLALSAAAVGALPLVAVRRRKRSRDANVAP